MNRLDKFRQRRGNRQKYLISALLFLFLLTAGLLAADYSTNTLMTGHQGIAMFRLENRQNYLELDLLNQKVYLNTQYINRDLQRLEGAMERIFGG